VNNSCSDVSNSLVHLSKVNICVNEQVSAIRMTIACVIVYR